MTFWLNDDSDGTFWQYSLTLGIQKTFRPPPTGVSPDWIVEHPFLTRSGELVLGGARPTQKILYSNKNHRCGISHYHASIKIPSHMHFVWGSRILRRGSVLYGIDPMQIWAPHKNSRIRIQESGSVPIHITFEPICRSGPLDLHSFCFQRFLTSPDPRIQSRFRISFSSSEKFIATVYKTSKGSHHFSVRLEFSWLFGLYTVKKIDADLDTGVRIRTFAFALVP
jgi:hypothetical protein